MLCFATCGLCRWRQAAFDASCAFAPALVLCASAEATTCETSKKNMKSCKLSHLMRRQRARFWILALQMEEPERLHSACVLFVPMLAGAPVKVNDLAHLLVFSCSWPCHEVNHKKIQQGTGVLLPHSCHGDFCCIFGYSLAMCRCSCCLVYIALISLRLLTNYAFRLLRLHDV